jgi:hypothetical protein
MFATAGVQEASSLHDCAISLGILVLLPSPSLSPLLNLQHELKPQVGNFLRPLVMFRRIMKYK